MNITLNTNKFNTPYTNTNRQVLSNNQIKHSGISYNQPAFTGGFEAPTKSTLLSPFKKMMDTFTDWIAKNYTSKMYESKLAKFLAGHTEKLKSVVDHMQVIGSVIISGMYMLMTLKNSQLDDEKAKHTLMINQGLTFGFSTIGSYIIDGMLNNKWNKFTMNYAIKRTGDADLAKKLKAYQDKCKAAGKINSDLVTYLGDKNEAHFNPDLAGKVRGMGILKKLAVFGAVYRFLSPVAVTPIATWIGNKLAEKRTANQPETKQAA